MAENFERIALNREQFETLKQDKNYTVVAFNPENGGMKATHVKHVFDPTPTSFNKNMTRGEYEIVARDVLFREGHKVVIKSEVASSGIKTPDGTLNDVKFEIKGVEGTGKRNIRNKMFEAAKQGAEIVVFNFPENRFYSAKDFKIQTNDYYRVSKNKRIKTIYYIIDNELYLY